MSARKVDPIISDVQERLRVAADLINRGQAELQVILRQLDGNRDPLAKWIYEGTHATLTEVCVEDAPRLLLEDTISQELLREHARLRRIEARRKPSAAA